MCSYQTPLEQVFLQNIIAFRQGLSDEEKNDFRDFKNPDDMVKDLRGQLDVAKNSKIFGLFEAIAVMSKHWEPFFDVITIFVSTKPDFIAPFWGALRLVLKLSLNYVSLFERLVSKFGEISEIVRMGADYVKLFRGMRKALHVEVVPITQALASIYDVAISFCQKACNIFTAGRKGIRGKIKFHIKATWTPFETRFSDLINRLHEARGSLDQELELFRTKVLVKNHETVASGFAGLHRKLQSDWVPKVNGPAIVTSSKSTAIEIYRSLLIWVKSPSYTKVFDRAKRELQPETLKWFLNHQRYRSWLRPEAQCINGSVGPFHDRVLGVLGSPGYGKTMLSVKVIESLQCQRDIVQNPLTTISATAVCYYHFSKLSAEANEPHHAFRALLAQALSYLQDNMHVLDAASLLIQKQRSGELIGSETEIQCMLSFALSQLDACTFVIDGSDECTELIVFLQNLQQICEQTTTKLLIVSRPDFTIPKEYRKSIYIKLDSSANLGDIRLYLQPRVKDLDESGLLPSTMTTNQLVDSIVSRSKSIFLWAKLMIAYLQSPVVTPRARMEAMTNMVPLEGLDAMYSEILHSIDRRMQQEREFVIKIFQWLVSAARPLTVSEFQAASAIRLHEETLPELDYIRNIGSTITLLSGSLAEVAADNTVQLVHLSVAEFLTRRAPGTVHRLTAPKDFRIDLRESHLSLASHCLSYLVYDVPAAPLSGALDTTADPGTAISTHPFLQYSCCNWEYHACRGLEEAERAKRPSYAEKVGSLLKLLGSFLAANGTLRLWVEGTYLFVAKPSARDLKRTLWPLSTWLSKICVDSATDIDGMLQDLRTLADGLDAINQEWADILQTEPNEIWDANIGLFTFPSLFGGRNVRLLASEPTTEQAVSMQEDLENDKSFILVSSISLDGQQLATLSVLPSKLYLDKGRGFYAAARAGLFHKSIPVIGKFIRLFSRGWRVRYHLQQIDPEKADLQNDTWVVPEEEVRFAIYDSIYSGRAGDVHINASISGDFRSFSVFSMVFRASMQPQSISEADDVFQRLEAEVIERADDLQKQGFFASPFSENVWQTSLFSDSGNCFAAICPGQIRIFEDVNLGKRLPHFQLRLAVKVEETWQESHCLFHPELPIICVYNSLGTFLVNFGSSTSGGNDNDHDQVVDLRQKPISPSQLYQLVFPPEIYDISFSACGGFLHGIDRQHDRQSTREFDVSSFCNFDQKSEQKDVTPAKLDLEELWLELNDQPTPGTEASGAISHRVIGLLNCGQVVHYSVGGNAHLAVLKFYRDHGVLVFEDFDSLGTVRLSKVLRLPKSLSEINFRTSLWIPPSETGPFRIFLTKDVEQFHDFRADSRKQMSTLIVVERDRSSIPPYKAPPILPWESISQRTDQEEVPVAAKDQGNDLFEADYTDFSNENGINGDPFDGHFEYKHRQIRPRWRRSVYDKRAHNDRYDIYAKYDSYDYCGISLTAVRAELRLISPRPQWCSWLRFILATRDFSRLSTRLGRVWREDCNYKSLDIKAR